MSGLIFLRALSKDNLKVELQPRSPCQQVGVHASACRGQGGKGRALKMCLQIHSGRSSLMSSANRWTQELIMAHVVTTKCVGCKFTDCVEVCPVACFYELENQLIIHPDECIDCTACVAECPVEAIYADHSLPDAFHDSIAFNAAEAIRIKEIGESAITAKQAPLPTGAQRNAGLVHWRDEGAGRSGSSDR